MNASDDASVRSKNVATSTHRQTQPAQIYKWELFTYFSVYCVYLLYGFWNIFRVRDDILKLAKLDFVPGWSLLGRPRDNSNEELEVFSSYISSKWYWYVLHVTTMVTLRAWLPQRQSAGHAAVTVLALVCTKQPMSLLLLGGLLATYYAAAQIDSKRLLWLLSVFWMLLLNFIAKNYALYQLFNDPIEFFTMSVTLYWTLLRCCSFVLNRIDASAAGNEDNESLYSLEYFLGYTLYFPMLANGPFLEFPRYAAYLRAQYRNTLLSQCISLAWQLCRIAFWWFAMQAALHFLYIHHMSKDVEAVALVKTTFGRHAIGYFLGQFFFIYYVVRYGLGISFAHFDGMQPPRGPRCIGRIHYYSDMWKYFDEGMYEFLFKHIYAELRRYHSKLLSIAATFTFVFVWHGCYEDVFIWSVLNFCCLVAEKLFRICASSHLYQYWTSKYLGTQWSQRLYALLASQLFIPAAFSNVYFIGGLEVGNVLMRGAYMSGMGNYVALSFCCYCFFQCAEMISNGSTNQSIVIPETHLASKKSL